MGAGVPLDAVGGRTSPSLERPFFPIVSPARTRNSSLSLRPATSEVIRSISPIFPAFSQNALLEVYPAGKVITSLFGAEFAASAN